MGLDDCTKCIKYVLFFFNLIFWIAGCLILGFSLWLRHDSQTSSLLELKYDDNSSPNSFSVVVYILIGVGAVMMFVGFLGCYGAIQESQCLLGTFFACLVILFACEVAAGIWGFMNREKMAKDMKGMYDSVYEQSIAQTIISAEKQNKAASVIKLVHETLNCCGQSVTSGIITGVGTNLCPEKKSILEVQTSCHTRIDEFLNERVYLIGIAALVVAVIMIFEMIFSMVLCCGIRNSPVY
ncbi:CD81 molecule a [Chanos chanos]|uniref:Tetraspanin n=1 Tax=Chanos chanos TaxID=29144 RepID=A0A6J2URS5_CHACN|nr:CD81 antigen [Chanos chanos]